MTLYSTATLDDVPKGATPTFPVELIVPEGRTIAKAYMTCKASPSDADGAAVFQVVGVIGTPSANGDGTTTVTVTFTLTTVQSAGISTTAQGFDVKVILDNGAISYPVIGQVKSVVTFTLATS